MLTVKWCMVIFSTTASLNLVAECLDNFPSASSILSTTIGESSVTQSLTTNFTGETNSTTIGDANLVKTSIAAANKNDYPLSQNVKQLIVITDSLDKPHLRSLQGKRKRKKKDEARVLLYREYDAGHNLLNSVEMKTMDDVAGFFKNYLGTTVCVEECLDPE